MNKYEKLIEYIINDDEKKARALFHEIVVEKSRNIYESLMDEEMHGEAVGGNPVDNMMDEIQADESGLPEDDEMPMDMGDEQLDGEMGDEMGGEMGDDMGGDGDIEGRVMDLESELEALKAEFEQLMAGEEEEGHHDDMDMDMDMSGGDDEGMGDESGEDDQMMEAAADDDDDDNDDEEEVTESVDDDDADDDDDDEMTESRHVKSEIELMREYVEKLGSYEKVPAGAEGEEVAKGGKVTVNKQSIVAGKNDMGGTTANIVKGGSEESPDGKQYKAPSNEYTKGQGQVPVSKKNVNVPGGNKGAQNWYNTKASAKDAEGSTTDGSMSVDKSSILKRIN